MLQRIRLGVRSKWVVRLLFALQSCVTLMFYACLPLIRVPTQVFKFCQKIYLISSRWFLQKTCAVVYAPEEEIATFQSEKCVGALLQCVGELVAFIHYGVSNVPSRLNSVRAKWSKFVWSKTTPTKDLNAHSSVHIQLLLRYYDILHWPLYQKVACTQQWVLWDF